MPQLNLFYRLISVIMIALFLGAPAAAQNSSAQPDQAQNNPDSPFPPAPIPAQILAARQVFISNAPGETIDLAGGPSRTYDQFYAAIKSWQKYQLVSTPAAADLVFEISITRQIEVLKGESHSALQIRLVMVDPRTNIPLWTISEPIEVAFRKATAEKNFGTAMTRLVNQLKQITAPDSSGPGVK